MNTKKSKVRLWSVLTALTAILTIAAIVGNMIANHGARQKKGRGPCPL